ncbi:plasmid mobilization protein [Ligilactobacillus salivarius]|uniref:plasmid mobilization protein n=1 Tax=Ligilactobacillus salivarius TaxID=1624 RepID=UPI000BB054DB|nr:hypothetical protein [Ligilactobacillus salivarius]PAY37604.1 hypothetical protein A8C34_10800 [Ligilactobacillus salivarius]PAY38311.1 hypothetical protein A8C54_10820 [Ligilactobacillus salivarius]PAY43076.1 hypothetical protein A8C55_10880 [Ligilactobacillus salivarius]PAY50306.1 hypothetical protein A8C37_10545 [Ligilactobacillus salivarius]
MFKRENRDEVIRLRVTREEKDILKNFAKEKGLTMSAVVAQALDNYLDATAPKDFAKMEVHYDGKKDKALTRKAQNALAFSKRFDEIMGNKTSLYDMDKKYQEAYFEKLEEGVKKYKDDEKSSKESKN